MAKPVRLVFLADDTQLRRALGRLVTQTSTTQAALKALERTGGDLHRIGRSMSVGLTAPSLAAAGAAAYLSMQYEAALTKIEALTGVSGAQVKQWGDQILELGPKIGKTPQELANSLYYIVSSGAKASDAMSILLATSKAAAAGLGETQVVADAVTSAMNAYGAKNLSAAQATDVLVKAMQYGKGEASEMASSIGLAIPLAATLGVSFHEVAAGMAALTQTGSSSSEAVTQLRGIFDKMIHPSGQVKKALKDVGLSTKDLQRSIKEKGLLDTLQMLEKRVGANKEMWGKLFPEVRGLLGVLSLVGPNGEKVEEVFRGVAGAGGEVNAAFGKTAQTNLHKWNSAMSSLSAAGIKIGDLIAPGVARLAEMISKLAHSFANLDPRTQKIILTVVGLTAVIGPLMFGIGGLLKVFSHAARHPILTAIALLVIAFITAYTNSEKFRAKVHEVVEALSKAAKWISENRTLLISLGSAVGTFLAVSYGFSAFSKYIAVVKLFGGTSKGALLGLIKMGNPFVGAVAKMKGAWAALNASFLFSPIGIVIALVAALVVAFIIAYKRSETFRNIVHKALHAVGQAAKAVWGWLVVGAKAVWSWIQTKLVPVFIALWGVIKTVAGVVWGALKPVVEFFVTFGKIVGEAFSMAAGFVRQHWGTISKILLNIFTYVFPIVGIVRLFIAIWKRWGTEITAVVKWAISIVVGTLKLMWSALSFVFRGLMSVLAPLFRAWWAGFTLMLRGLWIVVKATFTLIWNVIKTVVVSSYQQWQRFWRAATLVLKASWAFFKASLSAGVAAFKGAWNAIKSAVSTAVNFVKTNVTNGFNAVRNGISTVMNTVGGLVARGWLTVKTQTAKVVGYVTGIKGKLMQAGKDVVMGLVNGIKNGASQVIEAAKGLANLLPDWVRKTLNIQSPSRVMIQLGRYVVQGLVLGLTGSQTAIRNASKKLANLVADAFSGSKLAARRQSLTSRISRDTSRLLSLAKQRDAVAARLKSAQTTLTGLLTAKADVVSGIADKVRESFALIDPQESTAGIESTITRLSNALDTASKFGADIKTLAGRGLNKQLLEQLAAAGPVEGAAMAKQLVNATDEQLAKLNGLANQLSTVANQTGSIVGGALYDAGINAARGLVKGLESQKGAIERTMLAIAKSMQAALKRALGIKSPSRVFAALGDHIPAGVAVGIYRSTGVATAAVEKLAQASTRAMRINQGAAVVPLQQRVSTMAGAGRARTGEFSRRLVGPPEPRAHTSTGKTVHIENLTVNSQAKDVTEIGQELTWQIKSAAL